MITVSKIRSELIIRNFFLIILPLIFSISSLISQEDTLKINKVPKDSVFRIPSRIHGSMNLLDKTSYSINKSSFQDINYTGFSDLLKYKTQFTSMNMGSYGLFNSFSAYGALPNSISFQFNGRDINTIDLGTLNPEVFSTEFFENAEIFTGSDAIIFGNNSNGALINFQEIRYNTAKPFSRLWFSEAGFEYLAADGVYSQNFSKNWNYTFGFRNMATDGRFNDSWMSSWNVRNIFRWNPDDYTSLSFVHNFYNHGSGTGGGIDFQNSEDIFDNIAAVSNYPGMDEREFRHDLTLTFSTTFDSVSTNALNLSVFFSNSEWDRNSGTKFDFPDNDTTKNFINYTNKMFGVSGSYETKIVNIFTFKAGGDFTLINLPTTPYYNEYNGVTTSMYGRVLLNPFGTFQLSSGLRLFNKLEKTGTGFGGRLSNTFFDFLDLCADLSYSERIPEIFEGMNLKNEKHLLVILGTGIKIDSISRLSLSAFARNVIDPVRTIIDSSNSNILPNTSTMNESSYFAAGGYIDFKSKVFDLLNYEIRMNFNFIDAPWNNSKWFPVLSSYINLFYQYNTVKSILRVGIETNFATGFDGLRFIPYSRSFTDSDYLLGAKVQSINPYIFVKIGNGTVRAMFENALSTNYYLVSINPAMSMNFKLSFNWSFLED